MSWWRKMESGLIRDDGLTPLLCFLCFLANLSLALLIDERLFLARHDFSCWRSLFRPVLGMHFRQTAIGNTFYANFGGKKSVCKLRTCGTDCVTMEKVIQAQSGSETPKWSRTFKMDGFHNKSHSEMKICTWILCITGGKKIVQN